MLFYIRNAGRFHRGEITDFNKVGVKAPDDLTLVVELDNPTPFFLQLLTHMSYFPVHQATIEAFGAPDERGTRWTRPGNHVGNRPVQTQGMGAETAASSWRKNGHYWDAGRVETQPDSVLPDSRMPPRKSACSAPASCISRAPRRLDKVGILPAGTAGSPELFPFFSTYYYLFNTGASPLDQVKVRQP